MASENANVNIWNPQKDISKDITLEVLIRHRDYLKQARIGIFPCMTDKKGEPIILSDNQKIQNRYDALSLLISTQRDMITISRPVVYANSFGKWKKRYIEKELREKNPFNKYKCDYNELINVWLKFLDEADVDIRKAESTESKDDDYMQKKVNSRGEEVYYLTTNFFNLMEDLEVSYEQIYYIMIKHKIVSAGIEEDEDKTQRELEDNLLLELSGEDGIF